MEGRAHALLRRDYSGRHHSRELVAFLLPRVNPSMAKNGIRMNLERDVENAGLSKRLATVSVDAPIEVTIEAMRYHG